MSTTHVHSSCTHYRSKHKHTYPHKQNRTEHNHTTNHINIDMCAQTVSLQSDPLLLQLLFLSFSDGHIPQYICYACCTESYSPYNADSGRSPLVTPPPPSPPLPHFSSHLSVAFLSVNLSLPLYCQSLHYAADCDSTVSVVILSNTECLHSSVHRNRRS